MISILGLRGAIRRLGGLDLDNAMSAAVQAAAERLHENVVEALSHRPGSDHALPWVQSGALRDSIDCQVTGLEAVIGSSSEVALDQEMGTGDVPPRPFLATTAAQDAEGVVTSVASGLAQWLSVR